MLEHVICCTLCRDVAASMLAEASVTLSYCRHRFERYCKRPLTTNENMESTSVQLVMEDLVATGAMQPSRHEC